MASVDFLVAAAHAPRTQPFGGSSLPFFSARVRGLEPDCAVGACIAARVVTQFHAPVKKRHEKTKQKHEGWRCSQPACTRTLTAYTDEHATEAATIRRQRAARMVVVVAAGAERTNELCGEDREGG